MKRYSGRKMRKKYKIKKLIKGHKVKPELVGKFLVAIPKHIINPQLVIFWNGSRMAIKNKEPVAEISGFKDKYGRGKEYTLVYYEWKPEKQMELF